MLQNAQVVNNLFLYHILHNQLQLIYIHINLVLDIAQKLW